METAESQLQVHSSYRPDLILPLPKQDVSYPFLQELSEKSELFDDRRSQAKRRNSLIEDPLWDHVCTEVIDIMGPIALQIRHVHLGELSSQDKIVDLYCQSEDIAQFLERYDFLILGSLQHYFPALKELRICSADDHP